MLWYSVLGLGALAYFGSCLFAYREQKRSDFWRWPTVWSPIKQRIIFVLSAFGPISLFMMWGQRDLGYAPIPPVAYQLWQWIEDQEDEIHPLTQALMFRTLFEFHIKRKGWSFRPETTLIEAIAEYEWKKSDADRWIEAGWQEERRWQRSWYDT